MKFKKIISVILVILIMALPLTGCKFNPYKFSLSQDIAEVVQVEITKRDSTTFWSVLTLNQETANALLNDISNLYVKKALPFEYPYDYSKIVVFVTYKNGGTECISCSLTETRDVDGPTTSRNFCFVSCVDWYSVILKHTKSDLPDDMVTLMEDHMEKSSNTRVAN